MAERRPVAPRTFFLNETHEHARDDREGGGRVSEYARIDWNTKGERLAKSLRVARTAASRTSDPLRERRLFLLSRPEPSIEKQSKAKKAKDGGRVLDWYEGHRRIQTVLWIFADGKSVRQNLSDSREMQTIDVEPVEVTKVVLKIVATTEPGDGAARRDMTAISDVLLAETS